MRAGSKGRNERALLQLRCGDGFVCKPFLSLRFYRNVIGPKTASEGNNKIEWLLAVTCAVMLLLGIIRSAKRAWRS